MHESQLVPAAARLVGSQVNQVLQWLSKCSSAPWRPRRRPAHPACASELTPPAGQGTQMATCQLSISRVELEKGRVQSLPPFAPRGCAGGCAQALPAPACRSRCAGGAPQAAVATFAFATCSVHSGGQQRLTAGTHSPSCAMRLPQCKGGRAKRRRKPAATWNRASASAATVAAAAALPGSTYPLGRPIDRVAPSSCTCGQSQHQGSLCERWQAGNHRTRCSGKYAVDMFAATRPFK